MIDPHYVPPPVDMRPEAVRARIAAGEAATAWSRWKTGHAPYPARAAALLRAIASNAQARGITHVGMAYGWTMILNSDGSWYMVMV